MVFSKSYCPYCTRTKQTLSKLGIEAKVVELDQVEGGEEMHMALKQMSGQRTVPNTYINGVHLGGNDDL